ncbi:ROK family transcriptional regulator [Mediterraneibacter agrestimuris]|uniref:ROK family transcriptional regulator n=1 Tax=Mediterraneibacter agrestimuris TaxID=2941333 RepID=UPI00203F2A2B|nr:ROK family transcriptional regulator [Mediterraneibacter agrestimuris]
MRDTIKTPKRLNKIRIANFISVKGFASKNEIASVLNLSMPTTLQNVKELMEAGYIVETGEYESTGGRKAKALAVAENLGYAVGMDITAHHINFVLVNMRRKIERWKRIRLVFEDTDAYYEQMGQELHQFIREAEDMENPVIGVGISVPGIVNQEKVLLQSHALGASNISFQDMDSRIGYPYRLENDANCAAYAELVEQDCDTVYLSLSSTVGGAIYLHDSLYPGEHFRSGEFGHMVIEANGRVCYCGKKGCVDAYCSAKVLQRRTDDNLELFFQKVREGDPDCMQAWEEYMEYLAIAVTNLRMAFDCRIVLGGYVGGYLEEFLPELSRKIKKHNLFDLDTAYVRTGKYKLEASAYGAALPFVKNYFEENM